MSSPCVNCGADLRVCKDCEIYNDYIAIPKDATNGNMIMTMFPDVSVTEIGGGSTIVVDHYLKFNVTWWNSPYKRGNTDGKILTD